MQTAIIICALTVATMIGGVLFFPILRLGRIKLDSYWVIPLVGAILLLLTGTVDISSVLDSLTANTPINPLKILALFISMTVLSVYLDELGFFRYVAHLVLKRSGVSQVKLFVMLYVTVSILTVFTSNDIIILSFTPFICYFCKNADMPPMPYLAAEFVAANTWSMALIIGNPTNIYLATSYGIDFVSYLRVMLLPTLAGGLTALIVLYLVYGKSLRIPMAHRTVDTVPIDDKLSLTVGILHLALTTLMLALASYIDVEMWAVSLLAVVSLTLCNLIISVYRRRKPRALIGAMERAPYQLVPFVLSMFVLILSLKATGVTDILAGYLGGGGSTLKYGIASFLSANIVNNIPMSVLFSTLLESTGSTASAYATIIGSNLGALLTPIGALAGIMWSNILSYHGHRFSYSSFLKMGVFIAIPTLTVTLAVLLVVM